MTSDIQPDWPELAPTLRLVEALRARIRELRAQGRIHDARVVERALSVALRRVATPTKEEP